jgi:AraC-like DNA-binding protein/mannose-6-phosphate isomerase-like protein (cupin superfamily)
MENLKMNVSHTMIKVDVAGLSLNVFRVGSSPRIRSINAPLSNDYMKTTHTHFTFEVFFVTSGSLTLVTDHDTTEYKSCVLIIPPKLKHFSAPTGGESYCLLVSFNGETSMEEQLSKGVCELPITDDIIFYIKKFTEKSLENSSVAEIDATHLAALIFNDLFSDLKAANIRIHSKKKNASKHINAIEAYINNHIRTKLTLTSVAKNVFLSPRQVSRIIEKEYGCSFSKLITEKKLAIAAVMLKNSDMKIAEIANQIFCGSETYFYSLFKAKYGVSPLKYRKEMRIFGK